VWIRETDHTRAAALSEAILDLPLHPEDWVSCWEGAPPPDWVDMVRVVILAGLALPVELSGEELIKSYNEWVERRILEPLRTNKPEVYRALVEHLRQFVHAMAEDDDVS
jgi:hypothetical protein